jgi:hypothetical protein
MGKVQKPSSSEGSDTLLLLTATCKGKRGHNTRHNRIAYVNEFVDIGKGEVEVLHKKKNLIGT